MDNDLKNFTTEVFTQNFANNRDTALSRIDRRLLTVIEACRWSNSELNALASQCSPLFSSSDQNTLSLSISANLFGSFYRGTADRYSDIDIAILIEDEGDVMPDHISGVLGTWLEEKMGKENIHRHSNGFSLLLRERIGHLKSVDLIPMLVPAEIEDSLEVKIMNNGEWLKTRTLYQSMMFDHACKRYPELQVLCRLFRHVIRSRENTSKVFCPGFVLDTMLARVSEQFLIGSKPTSLTRRLKDVVHTVGDILKNHKANGTEFLGFPSFESVLGLENIRRLAAICDSFVRGADAAIGLETSNHKEKSDRVLQLLFRGNLPEYETAVNQIGWGAMHRDTYPGTNEKIPTFYS